MVRDGIHYALGCVAAAAILAWLTWPVLALVPLVLAAFFLWFFRDPERVVPDVAGILAPADGKVTAVSTVAVGGAPYTRVSIFLSPLDVHVNRSPVSGTITQVEYRRGQFRNAMGAESSESNEQNIVTVRTDEGDTLIFKQIAGLVARRIVFWKKVGDRVRAGERIGLMKFSSRMDVIFNPALQLDVRVGQRVVAGVSVLARAVPRSGGPQVAAVESELSGERV